MNDFEEIKQRVTIRDILLDAGHNPKGNRMPCPIHNGRNPTSFAFTDETFICYACGAKGGLIDIVQYLRNCIRQEAIRYLCQLAGIQYHETESKGANEAGAFRKPTTPSKRKPPKRFAELEVLKANRDIIEILRWAYTRAIQMWKDAVDKRKVSLSQFHAEEQYFKHKLEHWDAEAIRLTYLIHQLQGK